MIKKNVIYLNSKSFLTFARDLFKAIRRIRQEKIDVVLDFEFFSRISNIISFISGAKVRVGFDRFLSEGLWRGNMLTHKVIFNYYLHISQIYQYLVDALASPPGHMPLPQKKVPLIKYNLPKFRPSKIDIQYITRELEKQFPQYSKNFDIYIINPNATDHVVPRRRWPMENYIKLARKILQTRKNLIAIIGLAKEKQTAQHMQNVIADQRVIDFTGKTNLAELLTLLQMSKVLITNDGGVSNFASLIPITCITLFGPDTPIIWQALSKNNIIISADLACSPCINFVNKIQTPCQDSVCMKKISPEAVFTEIKKINLPLIEE